LLLPAALEDGGKKWWEDVDAKTVVQRIMEKNVKKLAENIVLIILVREKHDEHLKRVYVVDDRPFPQIIGDTEGVIGGRCSQVVGGNREWTYNTQNHMG
jgi:hypothetical protein